VSELLGSFGDNELSPECLHSSQHILSPRAISIPSSYTSYLQPIATTKLWADAAAYRTEKNLETAYVVKFHSANFLDTRTSHGNRSPSIFSIQACCHCLVVITEITKMSSIHSLHCSFSLSSSSLDAHVAAQPCFTFEHPDSSVPLINDRHTSLTFHLDNSALVHGLAGYFDTVLYGSVILSTHNRFCSFGRLHRSDCCCHFTENRFISLIILVILSPS